VRLFADRPLLSAPGEAYSYSSWGYTLIGAVVEASTSLPFVDSLPRQITPEIMTALRNSGVKVVTVAEGKIGVADLVAKAVVGHRAKTVVEEMSQRAGSRKRPMPKT